MNGNVSKALARVATVHKSKAGPFDAVFCVGKFLMSSGAEGGEGAAPPTEQSASAEPKTAEQEAADFIERANGSELKDYIDGSKTAVLPTYFVDEVVNPQEPQTWGNITRLAGFGNVEVCGLNVAYYTLPRPSPASGQWVRSQTGKGIDVLLTNEWPAGILKNLAYENYPASSANAAEDFITWASVGSPIVAQTAESLCPRYHFAPAARDIFYERPPYGNPSGQVTRFLAIAPYDNKLKQKFLYAASLVPVREMDKATLFKLPPNTTISPFVIIPPPSAGLLPTPPGRPRPGAGPGEGQPPFKRQRGDDVGRGGGRGQPPQRRDDRGFGDNCWFCLKSPQVEKHLVVSVGTEVYVTLAKGELVPEHLLFIPINHVPSVTNAPEAVRDELEKYKKSIKEYMKTKNKTIILFERFINKNHHCHLQVVPISEEEGLRAKEAITAEAARRNIRFEPVSVPARDIAEVVEPDQSYITIELPSGEVLLHAIGRQRVPMEIGRELVAALIGKPERSEWKACVLSKPDEIKEVSAIKQAFKPFDWSFE